MRPDIRKTNWSNTSKHAIDCSVVHHQSAPTVTGIMTIDNTPKECVRCSLDPSSNAELIPAARIRKRRPLQISRMISYRNHLPNQP